MIVDGKKIAAEMFAALANAVTHTSHAPHLTVVTCAPGFATKKYLGIKVRKARQVGITITVIELPETVTTSEVVAVITRAAMQTDGIIVQLPLPAHIATDVVCAAIPPPLDVDGVHYAKTGNGFLPPVVGAIAEIAARYDVLLAAQRVAVLGHGRLVGKPAAVWAENQGATVTVLTKDSPNQAAVLANATILILGAGVPGLVQPEMIKDGVVIFDAATAEDHGELRGDADPACAAKTSLFTPVPGGIGPITVAVLLQNLVMAAKAAS